MANILINDSVIIPEDATIGSVADSATVESRPTLTVYGNTKEVGVDIGGGGGGVALPFRIAYPLGWTPSGVGEELSVIEFTSGKADPGPPEVFDEILYVDRVEVSGDVYSTWRIEVDDNLGNPDSKTTVALKHVYHTYFNELFHFEAARTDGLRVGPGYTIRVLVTHSRRLVPNAPGLKPGNFNATIFARLD